MSSTPIGQLRAERKKNEFFIKGQTISRANYAFLNSSKKQTKLTIVSREDVQDNEFCSFFGPLLTFEVGFFNLS